MLAWTIWIAAGFIAGSIPFGYLIGRIKGINIREEGSGNIGATNVARVLGPFWGRTCFVLDMLKGSIPVATSAIVMGTWGLALDEIRATDAWGWTFAMVAPVFGHMFPPWLRGRGGKGIATGFGALVAAYSLVTLPALIAITTWFLVLCMTRYVSLGSIAAAASLPIAFVCCVIPGYDGSTAEALRAAVGSPIFIVLSLLGAVVIHRHRGNIARLRRGEEPKVTGKAPNRIATPPSTRA